ncbi:hypothetical protein C8J56DRAFT_892636 [Mycena floridula]|nr:hypothetical protein C8J56DRAFT_892636 [Mycena floridula]
MHCRNTADSHPEIFHFDDFVPEYPFSKSISPLNSENQLARDGGQFYRSQWLMARITWVPFVGQTVNEMRGYCGPDPDFSEWSKDLYRGFMKGGRLTMEEILPEFPFNEEFDDWCVKELFEGRVEEGLEELE